MEYDVTIQLQPIDMTEDQALRNFKTLRKAISKEKYLDGAYRRTNPTSRVKFELDSTKNTVTFILEDSTLIEVSDL